MGSEEGIRTESRCGGEGERGGRAVALIKRMFPDEGSTAGDDAAAGSTPVAEVSV